MNLCSRVCRILYRTSIFYKVNNYNTIKNVKDVDIEKIRNMGILAHIDAGKTTTTERMLYFAGIIDQMGEVHHGNTVTDYMDQERERGITITSAAVTFNWKKNLINLIDTPGHIDFTMEVEQTLNVLDGAVVVLDGSAGVEAQTQTVWRQADRYNIPRIIFVNKMDRLDADIKMCCEAIKNKLEKPYLLLQLPVRENGKLTGIIDVLSMELLNYGAVNEKQVTKTPLTEDQCPKYWSEAKNARMILIDKLTDHCDELADTVISSESLENIATVDIVKALNAITYNQKAVPVLLGSAYKNIGIQALMDAVVLYLPSPVVKNDRYTCFESSLCAGAFKVVHDKQRGSLVFIRIYNGTLNKGQKIYSIQQDCSEQIGRLYVAYADEFTEVDSVKNGNIAVVAGLKKIRSGDLITSTQSAYQKAKRNITQSLNERSGEIDAEKILGVGVTIPEPVFFCSIEPPSLAAQASLEQALTELQREDPSLRVTYNSETGQTVLAGMGELHLEIIRDRILKEYKIEADLGPLQIAYRESPIKKLTDTSTLETKIGNSKQSVTVTLSLLPTEQKEDIGNVMKLDKSPEAASNIASIFPKHLLAVKQGIETGLAHGPKIGSQVINTYVMLHNLEVGRGTSETMVTATVTQVVQKLVKNSGTDILEPVMFLEVVAPEEYLSVVLADLSRRRSVIKDVTMRGKSKAVLADTPLSELLGYATVLRTLTSGMATFTMEFNQYKKMSPIDEDNAIRSVRGF
ncbi:ribosome-releasing factor 2, mitochondrial [Anoplophora glabripennis]|uniref:ribosome-releasing factor 2, mitochondrial n=1 Tax=Anoplophora glabripennis TaxID=217634 RepID=UPI0008737E48|nr:ribosome-releasing factor 2, mitochondrial [Anoplophora glabripennis]